MIFALQTKVAGVEYKTKTILEKAISFYIEKVPELKYIKGIYIVENETINLSLTNDSKMVEKRRNSALGYIFIEIEDEIYFKGRLDEDYSAPFPLPIRRFIKSIPGLSLKLLEYSIPERELKRFFNNVSTPKEPEVKMVVQPKESNEILHAINTAPTKKLKYTWMNRMKEKVGSFLDELISLKRSKSSTVIGKFKFSCNKSRIILSVPLKLWNDALETINSISPNLTKPISSGTLQLAIFDQLYKEIPG